MISVRKPNPHDPPLNKGRTGGSSTIANGGTVGSKLAGPERRSARGKHSLIGLDLGAKGVRAVQLTLVRGAVRLRLPQGVSPAVSVPPAESMSPAASRDHAWRLARVARCERWQVDTDTPPAPLAKGETEGVQDVIAACKLIEQEIEDCLRQTEFRGNRVVTACQPPDAEFVALELPQALLTTAGPPAGGAPPAAGAQTTEVVRWEVQRLISTTSGPVETSHWTLPTGLAAGGSAASSLNAIGVAVSHECIDRMLSICKRGGVECVCLDTFATALCRFGSLLDTWGDDSLWGVLDVGDRQARLVLCTGGLAAGCTSPVLVRTVGAAGWQWTKAIAHSLGISMKAAETHKRSQGIAFAASFQGGVGGGSERNLDELREGAELNRTDCVGSAPGGVPPAAAAPPGDNTELGSIMLSILRSDLNDMAAEIKRSFEYVLSCYPSLNIADLVLVGGSSAMRNLPEFLMAALGITVRRAATYVGSTSCRLHCDDLQRGQLGALALAIGLAVEE